MSTNKDVRATCWCVVINHPTQADEENIQSARQKGWKVEGQLEKGSSGTPHYQLIVKTPQTRWSAIKKQFPRAHFEVARNPKALENYSNKEETRVGSLPETSDKYPSLAKLWDLVFDYIDHESGFSGCQFNSENGRLEAWDHAIRYLIRKGYHVETMGVNPQMRSAVKLYFHDLRKRSRDNIRRQTDRQTDENIVASIDIPSLEDAKVSEFCSAGSVASSASISDSSSEVSSVSDEES